ncbi:unnamed protein product, partial [Pylaiella littoralis]
MADPRNPGECLRMIKIDGADRVVKHTWKLGSRGGYVLTSVLLDKGTQRSRGAKIQDVAADNDEVIAVAKEHANKIRQRAESRQRSSASTAAAMKRKRGNADLEMAAADPLQAAITSGLREGDVAPRPAKASRKST